MSAQSNIARPYAQALFELAEEQHDLPGWHEQLQLLAAVVSDPSITQLAHNPRVSAERLSDLIIEVCGNNLKEAGRNLVKLLVKNDRVSAAADIAEAFAARKAEAEKVIEAKMITAFPVDKKQRRQFEKALASKLGRNVNLDFAVDEDLLGGAVIRIGDRVIDGSVKAQLEQLAGTLGH